jgi:cobalt-zinc-cadmium efflux system outer membrane protein
MRQRGRIFIFVLLTAAAASVASPQEPPAPAPPAASPAAEPPLTLDEAFALAATNNRAITAARLRRAIDQAGIDAAKERPNPDLRYEQAKETPHQSLTATQPIELGGKRGRRIALAEAVMRTGDAELARTQAEVRAQVRRAYYGLAATQARLAIALDLQGIARRARDVASERYEAGAVARLEVVQANLNLDQAENEATAFAGERDASRAELNALIGRDPRAPTQVVEDLANVTLPAAEAAAEAAMAGNAELAVLDREMAEAVARAALARAQQVPDPILEGAVTHDAPGEFVWGWRYAVGVTVPIFTRHRAAVRVEEATIAQLKAQREALVQRLEGAVGAALVRANTQRRQYLRYRDEILPRSREVEAMAEESYRAGQTNLVALLQALQAAREARARAVQAAYDYQVALAELQRAAAVGPPP